MHETNHDLHARNFAWKEFFEYDVHDGRYSISVDL